jgi:tRNA pseudouridine38-40 synthase
MVRLLTGTIVRCAQGRMDPQIIRELLARNGQRKTSFAAPAEGLYLARVLY